MHRNYAITHVFRDRAIVQILKADSPREGNYQRLEGRKLTRPIPRARGITIVGGSLKTQGRLPVRGELPSVEDRSSDRSSHRLLWRIKSIRPTNYILISCSRCYENTALRDTEHEQRVKLPKDDKQTTTYVYCMILYDCLLY